MTSEPDTSTNRDDAAPRQSSQTQGASGRELDRLPPPAFPPGTRRAPAARAAPSQGNTEQGGGGFPEGAFISPDEPVRRIGDGLPEGALISPDDPITPKKANQGAESASGKAAEEGDYDVEVTGIGASRGDVYAPRPVIRDVDHVATMLERVAKQLRENGPGDLLRIDTDSRLEAALRGFVAGYLLDEDA